MDKTKRRAKVDKQKTFSTELSSAQLERLALLSEELGEAVQAIGKIMRHGYESRYPFAEAAKTNRQDLEKELGDVLAAIEILTRSRDLDEDAIAGHRNDKACKVHVYMHFQA